MIRVNKASTKFHNNKIYYNKNKKTWEFFSTSYNQIIIIFYKL